MPSYTSRIFGWLGQDDVVVNILNEGDDSFRHDLQQVIEAVQAERTESLAMVREMQLAAQLLLASESARLAADMPGDERVRNLMKGSAQAAAIANALEQEIEIAAIRVPMVRKTEALIHGRIADAEGRPAGSVMVSLIDETGAAIADIEPVEVDAAGYYAIVVPAEAAAKLDPAAKLKVVVSAGPEVVTPALAPISLKQGIVMAQDVVLNDEELRKLRLRTKASKTTGARRSKKSGPATTGRARKAKRR